MAACNGVSSKEYINRTNNEFLKITGRGVTLIAASGDQGAPGDSDPFCSNPLSPLSTIFPGASMWATSVGATMLVPPNPDTKLFTTGSQPPICQTKSCAKTTKEGVCSFPDAIITTGGGFSNYIPRPTWQTTAVDAYLNNPNIKLPPPQHFNKNNRGFPDISALGHAYLISYGGQTAQVDGTSCSAPVIGALVSILNDYLLSKGLQPLGFINPLLYKIFAEDLTAYNDISMGNNNCTESCCSIHGFQAAKGWDPVTGLGTPNFPKMFTYVQAHPTVKKNK